MLTNWICLDVASAALPVAETYLDGTVRAPSNYNDQAKIDDYIAEKRAERLAMAAVDIDLAQVTGLALTDDGDPAIVEVRPMYGDNPHGEAQMLMRVERALMARDSVAIITFGGFNFDLPLLMRRARYLNVDFPAINLDRYKSRHVDLCELLSDRNPQRRRSLDFYVKRLGWDLPKALTGAEESQVPVTGRWDDLAASLRRDVEATYRLAVWAGVIASERPMSPEQAEVGF